MFTHSRCTEKENLTAYLRRRLDLIINNVIKLLIIKNHKKTIIIKKHFETENCVNFEKEALIYKLFPQEQHILQLFSNAFVYHLISLETKGKSKEKVI